MRTARAIHEGFMNGSRTILPRVGVGGGGGGGFREGLIQDQVSYLTAGRRIRDWTWLR